MNIVRNKTIILILLSSIVVIAVLLRVNGLTVDGLWMDEIFGASYTNLGFFETIVAVLRFDIHPPLYYLQLISWSRIFGNSDAQLLMNSVAWSVATILLTFVFVRRLFGDLTALLASLFVSLMAGEVFFAHELRMYSMISCTTILGWWAAEKAALSNTSRNLIYLIGAVAALSLIHAAGLISVSAVLFYFFYRSWPFTKSRILRAFWVCAGCAVVLLPCLANSSIRSISHGSDFGWTPLSRTISGWVLGGTLHESLLQLAGVFVVVAFCLIAFVMEKRLRPLILCFVVWPLFLGALMSLILRPMWVDRSFAFCAPFVAIVIASVFAKAWESKNEARGYRAVKTASLVAGILLIASMSFFSFHQGTGGRKMQYREAATYLLNNTDGNAVIYIPDNVTFWGVARYLRGSNWGNLLKVQDPTQPDKSDRWPQIYAKLGSVWMNRLGLVPDSRTLAGKEGLLVIGWSKSDTVINAENLWVAGNNAVKTQELSLCSQEVLKVVQFKGIRLTQMNCKHN
jgi:mannosyltransferase